MFNKLIVPGFSALLLTGIIQSTAFSATFFEQTLLKVQEAATTTLSKQSESAAYIEPKFEVEVVKTSRPLPSCPAAVTVETVDARSPSRMRFVAVCGASPGWRYEFVVRAKISAKVVIAATDLMPGKFLSPSDVLLERHDISGIPDSFSDLTAIEGMSTRRSVRAGDVLRQNMLVAPPLVKRGEQVRIVARREQIEVSMSGEALDTGARGASVRVRNSSGTIIRARVTDAGTVEPADLPLP
jgi:flagella basal body P-ring formation protein FlgA